MDLHSSPLLVLILVTLTSASNLITICNSLPIPLMTPLQSLKQKDATPNSKQSNKSLFTTHYFPQELDHFTFQAKSFNLFYQKYLMNSTHWDKGPVHHGPIFVYTGNEGNIEWFAENTGFMYDIAPKFGPLLVFIEHRFYGESLPFGNDSYKNAETLGYLTSTQALADYAILIRSLKQNLSAEASPVVVFGGSYGGKRTMEGERENIYDEPKRLSDFLRESDEELLVEINSKSEFQKISAKSGSGLNVSRFLWFGRRGQSKKQEEEYKDIMKKGDPVQDFSPVLCNPSATKSGNTSLTLGMGIGLYLLLSKSTSEYSKMAELHKQMKTLLEEIKKEFENKSRVCSCCSTESDLSCYLHKICDEENKCGKGDTQCVKMDQMESELEIELERMRFNFSEDSSSLTQEEQRIQIPVEWTDFCENSSSKFEQFDETWQDDCSQNYGVSPHELERKLHELLNHRQQERIEELESQLHSLERKLLERESEINQWKAIATTSSKTE